MSIKIIYGKSGSGKTNECYKIIEDLIENTNCNIIYMVPEQYSLQAERDISKRYSKIAMDRVEVLNFERLAGRTFSKVGPIGCDFLDDNAKLMLVEKAILKNVGKLTYFNKNAQKDDFASVILDIIKVFKKNCVTADFLKTVAGQTDNDSLKLKLLDIILIYEEYNKFFTSPRLDNDDNMDLLTDKIDKFNLFCDTYFVFDNFMTFTNQQLMVISKIMQNSPCVYFTLTTDDLKFTDKFQVFYKSKQTFDKLLKIAIDNNIEVLPHTYLQSKTDDDSELLFLKENYFSNKQKKFENNTEDLVVCNSLNYNTEVEQVGAEIKRLVREEGYRYKDFAVVTRSTDVYYPIIKDVFERFEISFNINESIKSTDNFMTQSMLSVFEIVVNNYSFDSVFDFVYSPFCHLSDHDKFLLENYVLEVGNTPNLWKNKGEINYKGNNFKNDLKTIENSINYVRDCISAFTDKFYGRKTVIDIVDAYECFLKHVDAEDTVKVLAKKLRNDADNQVAQELISVYNHILKSLSQMAMYFGDVNITFEKFYKILKTGLYNTKLDQIPSGVDDVLVTTVDRFMANGAKVVFAIGVLDGVLPCGYVNEGVIKDSELAELGIEEDIMQRHCDENYIIYRMFSSATDKLYISYPNSDNEGKALSPSNIILKLNKMFPNIKKMQNIYKKQNQLQEVEGVIPTFNKAIYNLDDAFWNRVISWYKTNKPELYETIINSKNYHNQPQKLSRDVVKSLYGTEIKSSVSRIEKYNQCAFSYFIRYGLNVDERKEITLKASDYGTYMHEIIEKYSVFAKDFGWDNITDEVLKSKSKEITTNILNDNLSEFYTDSKRYSYHFNKIISTMNTVLKNITEFYRESEYINLGNEVSFDEDGQFKPITLTLSDGTIVKLRGKVDRADIRKTDDGTFVSIIDYKSGNKDINYEKIMCGIQIQLPVYLDAVCKNLSDNGDNVIPGAIMYYHIYEPIVKGNKDISDEEILNSIKSELKMKGMLTEDSNIPGVFAAKRSGLVSNLDKVCKVAYKQINKALEQMISGDISINPISNTVSSACDYCPYGNICNFDTEFTDNKYRFYKKMDKEEFFEYADKMDS